MSTVSFVRFNGWLHHIKLARQTMGLLSLFLNLENSVVKSIRMSIQQSAQGATYAVSVVVALCLRTGSGCAF